MNPQPLSFLRGIAIRIAIVFLAVFVALQVLQQCSQQEATSGRFTTESDAVQRIAVSLIRRAQATGQPVADAQFLGESQAYLQAQSSDVRITRAALSPVHGASREVTGYRITFQLADEKGSLDVNRCANLEGDIMGCATLPAAP